VNKRIQELDSLRALACIVIMISHSLSILPAMYDPEGFLLLKRTPLAACRAGREAVIFFFILSGFVLSLPFLKGSVPLRHYYLQRVFRLWVPYVISLSVAIFMAVHVYHSTLPGLSSWANTNRSTPTLTLLLHHLFLLGSFPNGTYNPVLWTLVQIMRISIIFPLLMMAVCRWRWKQTLLFALGLSATGFVLDAICNRIGNLNDYDMTLHYAAVFIFGALLAKHRETLLTCFRSMSRTTKGGCLASAFLGYTHAYWFLPDVRAIHYAVPRDWIVAVAIALGIFGAIGSKRISSLLVRNPFLFLGKISFSIYLYHAVVLLSCVHLLYGKIPIWGIWIVAWTSTFITAAIAHFIIEIPSAQLGRRVIEELSRPSLSPKPTELRLK
jgi:peptidoglycan/LPS O-acetylase OafA/YrhL